jgi:hypothetical protein
VIAPKSTIASPPQPLFQNRSKPVLNLPFARYQLKHADPFLSHPWNVFDLGLFAVCLRLLL